MRSLFIVCGTTGCGKSTIATFLAEEEKCVFLEGDDFHPKANKEKMKAGCPLTDEDRSGWLETLSTSCIDVLRSKTMVIFACSALKKKYRDVFRRAVKENNGKCLSEFSSTNDSLIKLNFIFLSMAQEKASRLVDARARKTGHFMPATLVPSQYEILEIPSEGEVDCNLLDSNVDVEEVEACALRVVHSILAEA